MKVYTVTKQLNPTKPLINLDINNVSLIILHHVDAEECTWEDINAWHKANGWSCAGYGEFIRKNGDVYILRDLAIGAQCQNYNSKSYGIAVEGNYDKDSQMPQEQYESLLERVKFNKSRFPNCKEVAKHSEYYPTSCPGMYFPFDRLITELRDTTDQTKLKLSLNLLKTKRIINSPEYWIENAKKGCFASPAYVNILIRAMSNYLNPKPTSIVYENMVNTLVQHGVIKSPDYWIESYNKNTPCDGSYVATLLNNMATVLRGL